MASSDLAAVFSVRSGVVSAFDDHVGAGTIVDDADGRTWPFHCTRIADGSRSIPVDVAVTFAVAPGPGGFEAVEVTLTGA